MGLPDGGDLSGPDHQITPGSYLDQASSSAWNEAKARCKNQTDDINRSDMDMVTLAAGSAAILKVPISTERAQR